MKLNINALAQAHPAIALLLSRSRLVYEESCPSAATALDNKGNLTTFVGPMVAGYPLETQVEILKHELAHVIGHFWERAEAIPDCQIQVFNVAHDAAIHEAGCCNVMILESTGMQPVTCERLGVEPMPAEEIYEKILNNETNCKVVSCGRAEFLEKMIQEGKASGQPIGEKLSDAMRSAMGRQLFGGYDQSCGRQLAGTIPPTPQWAKKLYQYLEEFTGEERFPERSWQRGPSRRHELLPGWPRVQPSRSALIFLDASGSMPDAVLLQAVAAAQSVGLSVSVRVWSTFVSESLPPEPAKLRAEIERHGGGTMACHCAETIKHEKCVIWVSDAESGDGIPPERKGWVWVVTRSEHEEPTFTRSPKS